MPRLNTYLSADNDRRVRAVARKHDVPVSYLLEAVALCMTDAEIESVLARHAAMRKTQAALRGVLHDEIVRRMAGMTPEQIGKVLESIQAVDEEGRA